MQHYYDNVTLPNGYVVPGASVLVQSNGVAAALYSDNGVTPKANPLTTDATGSFDFYAANGTYTVVVTPRSGSATQAYATLFDVNDVNATAIGFSQLAASTGSSLIGFIQSGTGAVARTGQEKQRDAPKSFTDYGAVADYTGTPLYDGADSGRITSSDNTTAFSNLVNAAIAAGLNAVRIPAGHWGIKTGNLSFSNFDKLRIFGDGIGVTILDFIHEDTTHTGGVVVTPAQANAIATFTTGNELEFQDMTVKATTKGGLVNGTAGSNRVYEGAVWGFKIASVDTVRLTRVRAERFNYRGFSIIGASHTSGRVVIDHCEGFYNVSSGFWCENYAVVRVNGGEYAYNGVFGESGTGYGVTASSYVDKFIVESVYGHHNYRKAIDAHGCGEFTVKHCTFQDNVLFHFANVSTSPPPVTDRAVIVKNNTFSNGRLATDKAWLKTCYDQLATNGYSAVFGVAGSVFSILDYGTASDNIRSIDIDGNRVLCHYNGVSDTSLAANDAFMQAKSSTAEITFSNNKIDFTYAAMPSGSDVYSHIAIRLDATTTTIANNDIKFTQATAYTNATSSAADLGTLFEFHSSDLRLDILNNRFTLNDAYFMTSTGAGLRSSIGWTVAGSRRLAKGNTWQYTADPFTGFASINNAYFLGTNGSTLVPLQQSENIFVRGTVRYRMQESQVDRTFNSVGYRLPSVSKLTGADVFYIVLDKQYGTTARISTNDGSADLLITVPFSNYTGITGSSGNSLFSYSSSDASFSEDGLTKLKITIKAKADLSGDYWGRVTVDGVNSSFGVEKVVML